MSTSGLGDGLLGGPAPCPFCGGAPKKMLWPTGGNACMYVCTTPACPANGKTQTSYSEAVALQHWNRRAGGLLGGPERERWARGIEALRQFSTDDVNMTDADFNAVAAILRAAPPAAAPNADGLLPCPFCGEAEVWFDSFAYVIVCKGCQARFSLGGAWAEPRKDSIVAAWNRRAAPPAPNTALPDGCVVAYVPMPDNIPAAERWLWDNPPALGSVLRGLDDVRHNRGSGAPAAAAPPTTELPNG